jgi:hypothetical protein
MSSNIHLSLITQRWLRNSPLTPYVMGYFDHLIQCRYATETAEKYMAGIAHMGLWMGQSHLRACFKSLFSQTALASD